MGRIRARLNQSARGIFAASSEQSHPILRITPCCLRMFPAEKRRMAHCGHKKGGQMAALMKREEISARIYSD